MTDQELAEAMLQPYEKDPEAAEEDALEDAKEYDVFSPPRDSSDPNRRYLL